MSDVPRLLSADAIFLGDGPIVPDGAVVVDVHGCIVDAGPLAAMRAAHAGAHETAYRGLLLPGLVNAHTHLELSALRGRTSSGRGFVPWVDGMLAARLEVDEVEEADGIARGVAELLAARPALKGAVCDAEVTAASQFFQSGRYRSCVTKIFLHE
jgi:cytosine/adenosine deaminase-related metal-dependent hydrolase